MSTAKSSLINRLVSVAATETDLQKLSYAAKGLEALLPGTDTDYPGYYGVSWDESTDTFTQVGSSTAHVALPIQSRMRRCLLNDAGQVAAYLDANNSNYLSSGNPATLTGAAGQVMVEVPKYWTTYSYVGTVHTWLIADTPLPGFSVHPDFIKDGVEVDYRYYGAYDANIVGGKIQSVSGAYPTTSQTRAQFRTAAAARGAGWRQLTYTQWSSVLLLALVEFKTFDFKTSARMTAGRTALSGGSWTNGSYLALSGLSNSLGNKTGGVSLGGASGILTDFMSYRGIENFFGHIWQFLDGFTVDMTANDAVTPVPLWFTNNSAYFADTGSVGMTSLGSMPNLGASANGYVATLMANLACGFIGASIGATSSTKFRSYLWQYPDNGNNWRAPFVGGYAVDGAQAAPGSLSLSNAASFAYVLVGGRAGF